MQVDFSQLIKLAMHIKTIDIFILILKKSITRINFIKLESNLKKMKSLKKKAV